jgi:S-adenosylmethionine decarboxylase
MAHTKPPSHPSPLILAEPDTSPGPFEGPEKLLEVWFAPSPDLLPQHKFSSSLNGSANGHGAARDAVLRAGVSPSGETFQGLRTVPRAVWEEMLDIVKCKVLSVVEGDEIDAYLLR